MSFVGVWLLVSARSQHQCTSLLYITVFIDKPCGGVKHLRCHPTSLTHGRARQNGGDELAVRYPHAARHALQGHEHNGKQDQRGPPQRPVAEVEEELDHPVLLVQEQSSQLEKIGEGGILWYHERVTEQTRKVGSKGWAFVPYVSHVVEANDC